MKKGIYFRIPAPKHNSEYASENQNPTSLKLEKINQQNFNLKRSGLNRTKALFHFGKFSQDKPT